MPNDCHYLEGNANAERRVARVQELLAEIGLQPERVKMVHVSSAMAGEFASAATEMCQVITELGSNPLRNSNKGEQTHVDTEKKVEADL